MKPGDSLAGRAADGIQISDFFNAVLSRASINSGWVKEEVDMALVKTIEDKKGTIISILIEECEIPLQLRTRKYIDFRQTEGKHSKSSCRLSVHRPITLRLSDLKHPKR